MKLCLNEYCVSLVNRDIGLRKVKSFRSRSTSLSCTGLGWPWKVAGSEAISMFFKVLSQNAEDTYELVDGPQWLSIALTGELTGMPAAAGAGVGIPVIVKVIETTGNSYEMDFVIDVYDGDEPGPGDEELPPAYVNVQYYFKIPFLQDDVTVALVSGPGWLTLSADGVFGGMPAAADVGIYPVDVAITKAPD